CLNEGGSVAKGIRVVRISPAPAAARGGRGRRRCSRSVLATTTVARWAEPTGCSRRRRRRCFSGFRGRGGIEKRGHPPPRAALTLPILVPAAVTVVFGVKYDRAWLLESLQAHLSRSFYSVHVTKALDLSSLKSDTELAGSGLYLPLNKPNVVTAVLELLSQIPNLELAVLNLSRISWTVSLHFAPLLERLAPF
uniref:Tap-RNA_bind domain-containing protein n=1 Tax=Macrostomum lignano TaxID=282301 RepID=A0A1I8FJX1_9PLAT